MGYCTNVWKVCYSSGGMILKLSLVDIELTSYSNYLPAAEEEEEG